MLFSLLLAGNLVLLPAAIVKTVTVLAWNHPAPSNSKLVYAIAHYAVVRGMHYVLMYVTSKVLCIMVNFWPDLQFINNENCHTQHEQAFQKRRWPYQSAFWQSGEQYTTRRQRLQRRRAPEAPQLAQLYSSSSSGGTSEACCICISTSTFGTWRGFRVCAPLLLLWTGNPCTYTNPHTQTWTLHLHKCQRFIWVCEKEWKKLQFVLSHMTGCKTNERDGKWGNGQVPAFRERQSDRRAGRQAVLIQHYWNLCQT